MRDNYLDDSTTEGIEWLERLVTTLMDERAYISMGGPVIPSPALNELFREYRNLESNPLRTLLRRQYTLTRAVSSMAERINLMEQEIQNLKKKKE